VSSSFLQLATSHTSKSSLLALFSLKVVFHLSQLGQNAHWLRLAGGLLYNGVLYSHEDIVLLLVTNGELARGHFVVLGEILQILDWLALQHRDGKLDVGLGVFVTGLFVRISLTYGQKSTWPGART
jgi:hypothetical protein